MSDALPGRFRDAMAELPAGVAVIVARGLDGLPVGATVSSLTSLSVDPPRVVVCLAETSDTCRALEPGHPFALQLLRDGQEGVAHALAGKGTGKFVGVPVAETLDGFEIDGCAVTLRCRVDALLPGGDHVIVVGVVRDADVHGGEPLFYHRRAIAPVPALGG